MICKKIKRPKIKIDVKRNETLAKERKEIAKNSKSLFKNVLVIYIDALSRPAAFRKIPKTMAWFDKYYQLNKKDSSAEMERESIEF